MIRSSRYVIPLAGMVLICTFANGFTTTISAPDADVIINGAQAQDWFGSAIGIAGDVNNNGRKEIIIGAPVSDADSPNRPGKAYVYDALTGALVWEFNGDQNGDKLGAAVAGIGDLNGDGHADVLVGAPGHDHSGAGGADAGRAYVFCGATGEVLHTLTGEAAGDWFGFSVAGVGLIDDDAVLDFAVGARSPSNGRLGYVYIYSGATGNLIRMHQGEASGQHFGYAVAGGGDVNQDGVPDIIVSAPFHPAPGFFGGRAYVFSGHDGALLHTFTGEAQSNFFGISIAIVGDVNGDGRWDILIGADANSAGGTQAGRAYLYSGADGALLHVITGQEVRGRLGRSVSAAGDVNGDGYADLLIGQPAPAVAGGSGNGKAFLIDGTTGETLMTLIAMENNDFFGFTCVGGADLTGDARLDVAIGAFASNIAGTQSGRVDVFHTPYQPAIIGDINGDGMVNVSDLLAVINGWGPCDSPCPPSCAADIAPAGGDCVVNVSDLLAVINGWSE